MALFASIHLHGAHSAQIESQANEFELGFYLFQAPHTELAKPQNVFDPAVGRLGNPFALAVVKSLPCPVSDLAAIATVCK